MAWRDRLRRRTAVPDSATPAAAPEAARGTTAVRDGAVQGGAVRGGAVPGDWDGGWRMTAPPALTVARAAIGVSDGLAFRSGLAAWRDPSFDTGLAHALLPSAPAGLVRGVARPAGPRSGPGGGGPLLLRALHRPHEEEPSAAPGASRTAEAPQISRRVRPGSPASPAPSRPGGPAGPDPVVARGGAPAHSAAVLGTPAPAVQRAARARRRRLRGSRWSAGSQWSPTHRGAGERPPGVPSRPAPVRRPSSGPRPPLRPRPAQPRTPAPPWSGRAPSAAR